MTTECVSTISLGPVTTAVAAKRFVSMTATGVDLSGVAAGSVGVSQEDSAAGSTSPIAVAKLDGAILEVSASAAIAKGAEIGAAADGKARTAVSGDQILGYAVTAAGAADDVFDFVSSKSGAKA